MRRAFLAWSEIIFIDGTYNVLRLGYTLILIVVEDSNGNSEIVSVGILNEETETNFEWLIETFKNKNIEACKNLKCIMADKDGVARKVMKKMFDIPMYICILHVLKIFS